MSDVLRAGLVGCGSVAQRGILPHLSQPDAQARLRLVALADMVEERARLSAERFGVPQAFSSVHDMLVGADLDLVIVATPIPSHYSDAMAAIEAGKHVYVQKTMTTSLAEADALLAARDRQGVRLAAAPGFELFPATAGLRQAAASQALGPIYLAYSFTLGFGHEQEPIRAGEGAISQIDPRWYYRANAGPLPDVTVYGLQLATSVLGPVRRVTAMASRVLPLRQWRGESIEIDVEDNNVLLMEFAAGALGVAVGADCAASPSLPWGGLMIYGQYGALEVTEVDYRSGYPIAYECNTTAGTSRFTHTLGEQPYLTGAHLELDEPHIYVDIMDLVDAVQQGRAPIASGEQARHMVEIVEKARLAISSGAAQNLTSTF